MNKFTKIGDWLPVQKWLDAAKRDAFEKAGRHDVPTHVEATDRDGKPVYVPVLDEEGQQLRNEDGSLKMAPKRVPVAPDLRDTRSRWWGAPGGGRLSGQVALDDLAQGSHSSAVPALMGLVTIMSVLASVSLVVGASMASAGHTSVGVLIGQAGMAMGLLGALACLAVLWHGVGRGGVLATTFWSGVVPFVGVALTMGAAVGSKVFGGGPSLGLKSIVIGVAVIAACAVVFFLLVLLFTGKRDLTQSWALNAVKGFSVLAGAALVSGLLLPGVLQPLLWVFIGGWYPYAWAKAQRRKRAYTLSYMSARFGGDDGRLGNSDKNERIKQAKSAEADKSGFIIYGKALGVFTRHGDGFSPDKGAPVGQSPNDLMTHKHIFGKTGTGKSLNEMEQTVCEWILNDAGGSLILDGKGPLPAEILAAYVGLPNVLLIVPGIKLALLQGLAPEEAATAISDLAGAGTTKQEQSADAEKFFNTKGKSLLLDVNLVLKALVELGKIAEKDEKPREWYWTLEHVDILKTLLKDKNEDAEKLLHVVQENIDLLPNDLGCDDDIDRLPLLRAALISFPHKLWTMPSDTRGGVVSVVDTWIEPLMWSPKLRPWACTEYGEDPTICLRGGHVGMSLPDFQYGEAGKLCQNLIRHRVMSGVRRRQDKDWQKSGQRPLLFLIDEAQEMIGVEDRRFLTVARSHGGACVYATQNIEAYTSRMGMEAAISFLDNFRSKVVLISSHGTYEMMMKALPEGKYVSWEGKNNRVIGYEQTLAKLGSHVVFDDEHELATEMRRLRRAGAGKILVPERKTMWSGGGDSYHDMDNPVDAEKLATVLVHSGKMEKRPLLTHSDVSTHLRKQTAVVELMRGGVPRHDFIEYPHQTPEDIAERTARVKAALIANYMKDEIRSLIKHEWQGETLSKTRLHELTLAFVVCLMIGPDIQLLEGADLFEALEAISREKLRELDGDRDLVNATLAKAWLERQEPALAA